MSMRVGLVLCVMLTVACTGQVGATVSPTPPGTSTAGSPSPSSPSPSPSSTPPRPMPTPSFPPSSGGVVEYAVPAPRALPPDCVAPCVASLGSLTLGSDGNIWFADTSRGQVGRISPTGQIAQFAVPSPVGGA